jgi:hypothetical protein
MFSLLAIIAVMLSIALIPIITTMLFVKTTRDDLEFQRELLATAVQVEKIRTSWHFGDTKGMSWEGCGVLRRRAPRLTEGPRWRPA